MNEARLKSQIEGRVVAITGAARGIGLATAGTFLHHGARVVIGDIDEAAVKKAAAGLGNDVEGIQLDVTDEVSFKAFVEAAQQRFGRLDVLVNNAGIMPIGHFLDESDQTSKRALLINSAGPLIGMRAALPGMIASGKGHIVNVASAAGKTAVAGGVTYSASKAATIAATESARVEFAGTGVLFTCVMPSFTNTELISGTTGTRFIRNLEPREVGEAIVRAVAERSKDVFLPAAVGVMLQVGPLFGRRVRDFANHLIGADSTFLQFDHAARKGYDDRIQGAPGSTHTPGRDRRRPD
jgi:NAD(P)-dependent dehydrogenase (short-subunit alcohol dehydrogenase family)